MSEKKLLPKYNDNFDKQEDQLYNAYEKDIALVNIYFGDSTVLGKTFPTQVWLKLPSMHVIILKKPNVPFAEFERSPKMTWFDFISSFGGICGLCLGISFVSVTEILYWFSIRLCKNF